MTLSHTRIRDRGSRSTPSCVRSPEGARGPPEAADPSRERGGPGTRASPSVRSGGGACEAVAAGTSAPVSSAEGLDVVSGGGASVAVLEALGNR